MRRAQPTDRILILADMEGIIGVSDLSNIVDNSESMLAQLKDTIAILNSFNYKQISICIVHDNDPQVAMSIASEEVYVLPSISDLIDKPQEFSFAIMIGFHGMRNSEGTFSHTFRNDIIGFYFGAVEMGEVGAFARWLESECIPVVFISGEGCFSDEVVALRHVTIHTVSTMLHRSASHWYRQQVFQYCTSLEDSLREWQVKSQKNYTKLQDEIVRVFVDNKDKYRILKREPYFFNTDGDKFIFKSLYDFFSNLIRFCNALNCSITTIRNENLELFKIVKQITRVHDLLPMDIVKKPIDLVTEDDRWIISKIAGIRL